MTRFVTLIFSSLFAITSAVCAAEECDIDLIAEAKESGIWTDDRAAAAVSIRRNGCTGVYILLVQSDGKHTTVDISRIENGLFKKLGLEERGDYEKYETQPVEWSTADGGSRMLMVRLQAWRDGQRYTVKGPVIIHSDGSILWQ